MGFFAHAQQDFSQILNREDSRFKREQYVPVGPPFYINLQKRGFTISQIFLFDAIVQLMIFILTCQVLSMIGRMVEKSRHRL